MYTRICNANNVFRASFLIEEEEFCQRFIATEPRSRELIEEDHVESSSGAVFQYSCIKRRPSQRGNKLATFWAGGIAVEPGSWCGGGETISPRGRGFSHTSLPAIGTKPPISSLGAPGLNGREPANHQIEIGSFRVTQGG
jgi:hypothetical protein